MISSLSKVITEKNINLHEANQTLPWKIPEVLLHAVHVVVLELLEPKTQIFAGIEKDIDLHKNRYLPA